MLTAYGLVYQILQVQPVGGSITAETTEGKPLHELLGKWGHHTERLALYEGLLGQLPLPQEMTLIDGMAHAFHAQGKYETVLQWCDLYQELLVQLANQQSADDLNADNLTSGNRPGRGRLRGNGI